jgi:transposase
VADFVPAGHPAHLIRDLASEELDLSAIMSAYTEVKGYLPYHPAMMVALLLESPSRGGELPSWKEDQSVLAWLDNL